MSEPYTPSRDTARNLYAVGRDEADGMIQPLTAFDEFDRLVRRVQAEAWLEGMAYGVNYDAGDYEVAPEPILNPYESEAS